MFIQLLPLNEFQLDTLSGEVQGWRRVRPQTHKTVTMEGRRRRWAGVLPHCKKLHVLAKLIKKAVRIVGGSRTADKEVQCRGRCQGPEETVIAKAPQILAASSHVKAPVGEGKSSGLQDSQEVPEKWPYGSSIGRKINSFFAAGLDEERVENHSTNHQ